MYSLLQSRVLWCLVESVTKQQLPVPHEQFSTKFDEASEEKIEKRHGSRGSHIQITNIYPFDFKWTSDNRIAICFIAFQGQVMCLCF